ncbi:MAG: methyltransferase domain-containing protein, partial [Acidobacteriota bacterium]|nr:methyltransferase domain-containing protein [Acidobacteriota bacterium]
GVRARLAVVPCCHDLLDGDTGCLDGWLAGDLAIDIIRARHLVRCGYRIWTQTIPADITPKNRVLLGAPE